MKLTCLLALFGLSSSLVISPPALPRAGMPTRHRALFMQEEDQPPAAAEDDQTTRCDAHQSSLPPAHAPPGSSACCTPRLRALLCTRTPLPSPGASVPCSVAAS